MIDHPVHKWKRGAICANERRSRMIDAGLCEHGLRQISSDRLHPALREGEGVVARAARHVEYRISRDRTKQRNEALADPWVRSLGEAIRVTNPIRSHLTTMLFLLLRRLGGVGQSRRNPACPTSFSGVERRQGERLERDGQR